MDDECVAALGRPISSLKVTELREELAKRNLTKTGNKKDLIDRLRADLLKIPSSEPDAQDAAVDLQLQPHQQLLHQDQIQPSQQTTNYQQQEPLNLQKEPQHEQQATALTQETNLNSYQENLSDTPKEVLQQQQQDQRHPTPQLPEQPLPTTDDSCEKESKSESIHVPQQLEPSDKHESDIKAANETEVAKEHRKVDTEVADKTAKAQEPTKDDSEVEAPVSFSLKRGSDSRNSGNKEKRRKWSSKTKSSESAQGNEAQSLIGGGISSLKLQELIVDKPSEAPKKAPATEDENDKPEQDTAEKSSEKSGDSKLADNDNQKESTELDSTGKSKAEAQTEKEVDEVVEEPAEPTNVLLVENLVRPFTLTQLKEVLTQHGSIVEGKFWTDKVKSKCCVMLESIEIARATKDSLHGQQWPSSNPKTLKVYFTTEERLEKFQKSDEVQQRDSNPKSDSNENGAEASGRSITSRLGERLEDTATDSVSKRLAARVPADGDAAELDDLFNKTKAAPSIFWLPLTEEQAVVREEKRRERESRLQEIAANKARRSPPPRRRSPSPRRPSPPRRRAPVRRSPPRRSPPRRSPPRRSPYRQRPTYRHRSPMRHGSPPRRRSPSRSRSPSGYRSPPGRDARRRSPLRRRSPALIRRSPFRSSPNQGRRSPRPTRRSPGPMRRSPGLIRRSPLLTRRSPLIRGASPSDRSPPRKRSPLRRRTPPRHISPVRSNTMNYDSDRRLQRLDRL